MNTRTRHIPTRTCVVCRVKGEKRHLTRIVRAADGVQIDQTGKINGRGAYLCNQPECWQSALQSNILGKALRTQLTDADFDRLRQAAS